MKLRTLPTLTLLVLLLALSSTSQAQTPTTITEAKVMALLSASDRAARNKNLNGVVAHIAPNASIKIHVTAGQNQRERNLTRAQYIAVARPVLRLVKAVTLDRKVTGIKIYNNGEYAMVNSTLNESMTFSQGVIRSVSSEVLILHVRNGRILITSIDSKSRIY